MEHELIPFKLSRFMGWPGKDSTLAQAIVYSAFFGWLLIPLKNTARLLTEVLPLFLADSFWEGIKSLNANDTLHSNLKDIGMFFCGLGLVLATTWYFIGRALTSPITSAKAMLKRVCGFFSRDEKNTGEDVAAEKDTNGDGERVIEMAIARADENADAAAHVRGASVVSDSTTADRDDKPKPPPWERLHTDAWAKAAARRSST